MERWNKEGVPRHQLEYVLTQPKMVAEAVRIDRCLLCRNPDVNEAGLCSVCVAVLNDRELELLHRWRSGIGP
ncbi:MAG TPA: hypothetical protein PLO61_04200 [Fimbriimonadaceae bacterium]|nr:hypothetical protein [Fimbriimonadaceae bacterium]HRJ32836.1 hypothetical protein [Fimbriimonadaceae bacterium]